MSFQEELITLIQKHTPVQCIEGVVVSVDASAKTCEVEPVDGRANFVDVKLQPLSEADDNGVFAIPVKNSTVIIGLLENGKRSVILKYTEIEKYVIQVSDKQKLVFDKEGDIVFNDGKNGGLIKISDLVKKLNNLEKSVNQVVTSFNAHTHVSPPAPVNPVNTAPPSVPSTVVMVNTTTKELENSDVKH